MEALENGFLDKYAWGYDQARSARRRFSRFLEVGAQRKNVVKQLRGPWWRKAQGI